MPWAISVATAASAVVMGAAKDAPRFLGVRFFAIPIPASAIACDTYRSGSELMMNMVLSISPGGALPKVLAKMALIRPLR